MLFISLFLLLHCSGPWTEHWHSTAVGLTELRGLVRARSLFCACSDDVGQPKELTIGATTTLVIISQSKSVTKSQSVQSQFTRARRWALNLTPQGFGEQQNTHKQHITQPPTHNPSRNDNHNPYSALRPLLLNPPLRKQTTYTTHEPFKDLPIATVPPPAGVIADHLHEKVVFQQVAKSTSQGPCEIHLLSPKPPEQIDRFKQKTSPSSRFVPSTAIYSLESNKAPNSGLSEAPESTPSRGDKPSPGSNATRHRDALGAGR